MVLTLIRPPWFDSSPIAHAADEMRLGLEQVCHWEQFSDVCFGYDGMGSMQLNGIPIEQAGLTIFAGYPDFAIDRLTELPLHQARGEWNSTLDSWIHSRVGKLLNRAPLQRQSGFYHSALAMLPLLAEAGWPTGRPDPARPARHVALSRWRAVIEPGDLNDDGQGVGAAIAALDLNRIYARLTRDNIDVLFVRMGETGRGWVATGAQPLPPQGLSGEFWKGILRAVLPLAA